MRGAARWLLVAALAAPGFAHADGEGGALEVDLPRWEASDTEVRWATLRAGGHEDAWIPFLAKRKEHGLLEWLALADPTKGALDALFAADAPSWPRVALWSLGASDTHKLGGARALLVERRPGLALDWLERHPEVTATEPGKTLLADLRKAAPTREDGSSMLPPLAPEEVLAPLSVGTAPVEDLGDLRHAEPGRVYASQVVRAIDVLAASKLRDEPWRGRLLALLKSPRAEVRRKAALAFSHFPPAQVPATDLLARVDDAAEDPGVRAAAVVGLARSSEPRAYLTLLRLAREPGHPAWQAAISTLAGLGDGFVLEHLRDVVPAGPEGVALLGTARESIEERWAQQKADASALAERIPGLLARAAWADLMCDPVEAALVPWTQALLAEQVVHDAIRKALERVVSEDLPELSGSAAMGDVRDRARSYARTALEK